MHLDSRGVPKCPKYPNHTGSPCYGSHTWYHVVHAGPVGIDEPSRNGHDSLAAG